MKVCKWTGKDALSLKLRASGSEDLIHMHVKMYYYKIESRKPGILQYSLSLSHTQHDDH